MHVFERSIWRISPQSTLPGPTSTKMHSLADQQPHRLVPLHRAGDLADQRVATAYPHRSRDQRRRCTLRESQGLEIVSCFRSAANRSCAGFISEQWNGALTGSILARFAPRSSASFTARSTAATCSGDDNLSGELMFAASQTSPCGGIGDKQQPLFRISSRGSPPSRPFPRALLPACTCRDCGRCERRRRNRTFPPQRVRNILRGYVRQQNAASSPFSFSTRHAATETVRMAGCVISVSRS